MAIFDDSDIRITVPAAGPATRPSSELGGLRPAELFDAWLFAETDATLALAAWRSAARAEKPDAHAAYVAALDREERASVGYEHTLRRSELAHDRDRRRTTWMRNAA
jgi:hypothetical protein